jgi:spermidine synthase
VKQAPAEQLVETGLTARVTLFRRLRWVALAAVPSSLMLGATTYMTTDIAAIPLLWILPLTLYLLSFILVFSKISDLVQAIAVCVAAFVALGLTAWIVPTYVLSEKSETLAGLVRLVCVATALGSLFLLIYRQPGLIHRVFVLAVPLLILLLLFVMLSSGARPKNITFTLSLHLLTLFAVAMVCHGELARDRPAPRHLTEFFLLMSVGGAVGGLFNALIAPVVFNGIVEYQLAMVVACFLIPPLSEPGKEGLWNRSADYVLLVLFAVIGGVLLALRVRDGDLDYEALGGRTGVLLAMAMVVGLLAGVVNVLLDKQRSSAAYLDAALPLALLVLVAGLDWGLVAKPVWPRVVAFAKSASMGDATLYRILVYGIPAVLCYTFVERPVRFGLSVAALTLAVAVCDKVVSHPVYQERSFFGVLKVEKEPKLLENGKTLTAMTLMHGTTWHGTQHRDESDPETDLRWRQEPVSYYHHTGPIGHVFEQYNTDPSRPFGVIGLGTGTMAAYALPGQDVTFYDIDPVVRGISFDSDRFFTYVSDARARGAKMHLVMGDARLTMERQQPTEDEKYALLVVDAFSSDAIPVHLITWEALQLYLEHMRPDGIVLFHISNRYLNLRPVLANFAEKGGLTGYVFSDDDESAAGKARSSWVAIARKPEHLDKLLNEPTWEKMQPALQAATLIVGHPSIKASWQALKPNPKVGVWTDDYSNLLSVFDWGF